jgi:hypothetical protein
LQRTIGNQAVGRLLAHTAAPVIQRNGNENEEEKPPLTAASSPSAPLLLTDRPWEQIERERNPLHKMAREQVFGENHSDLPKPRKPDGPITLEGIHLTNSGKVAPNPEPLNIPMPVQQPLALTDRPWSQIVSEKRKAKREEKRGERKGKRDQFLAEIKQQVEAIRKQGSTEDRERAERLLAQAESEQGQSGMGDAGARLKLKGKLTTMQQKIQTRGNSSAVSERLWAKARRYEQIKKRLRLTLPRFAQATFLAHIDYFDGPGDAKQVVDANLPTAQQAALDAEARRSELDSAVRRLDNRTDNQTALTAAEALETKPVDATIDGAPGLIDTLTQAYDTAINSGQRRSRKETLLDTYLHVPHKLMPHVRDWIKKKYSFDEGIKKVDFVKQITSKLQAQRRIPKRVMLKDVMGYDLVERPKGRLYLRHVAPITLSNGAATKAYEVHISVFANAVQQGEIDISDAANTKQAVASKLLAANAGNYNLSAHATLELFEQADFKKNPHYYLPGTFEPRQLHQKSTDPANSVSNLMSQRLATESTRLENEAETLINAGGTAAWPELA